MAEIAEPLTGPARANPLLRDPVLFDMYMRALDEVLDDRELSVAFNEFGLSAAKLRRAMVMGARRVLGAVSREFAAYERTLDRQLDVADAARAAGDPRPLGELSGALRPLAVATGAAGALVAVAGVAGMVAWPWAEPLVWAGGTMLVVAALLYASLRLLRTNFGLRLLRDDLILGVNPDLVVARDRLMAAVSQTELLSQVRMFVNTARRGRFGHTFSVTASPGLSEVYDRTYSVPTGIATELDELLGRLDGASIGVAGPRGCGKSTLIRRYCDDGGRVQTRPEKFSWNMLLSPDLPNNSRGDLRCLVAAPVDYVPRDFVLHMFAVFCRAVIGRYGRKPGATDRLARGLYWLRRKGWLVVSLLLRTFFYAGPGVVLLYWTHAIAKQISVPSSRVRYAAIGVISVGILSFARSSVKTVRLWGRVAGPGGNKALAVTARRHLARVRYLQTHTSGWSGALRHPGGSRAQRSGSTSRAEQPLSYPEIVDEFRTFAREVAADVHRNGDRVFIGIDELDKIGSAEQAEHFLNEIKGIFGIPHLYFVVSVSDDALTAFDRRGLPLRDAFDSSFDEIIHVGPLGYEESRRLLYRRVIGLTEPYVALCYCLAGGLARDLIRAARHVVRTAAGLTANKSSSLALDTGVFGLEVTGGAVNSAFRMLEAQALKNALNGSAGVLALAASPWFFEEVIRHTPASAPESYRQTRISVKETRDTAWICLPDDPYPRATAAALPAPSAERSAPSAERPAPPMAAVPRQLPVVTWGFAGRVAELAELTSALEEAAEDGGTVVISAIEGTAGIGKTTLAVYWAHQVADRFPDGQLYVNLRGFDPAGSPMAPAEAVRGFLDALGVPPERIPVSLHAQTALYRSLLAGRRVLVVLDNALDAA